MLPRCVVDADEVWMESPGRRVTVIYVLGGVDNCSDPASMK